MSGMKRFWVATVLLGTLGMTIVALGQKDKDDQEEGKTALVNFLVLKDDNGKPVRNAAVIMHSISGQGKQEKGGMELKTDAEGRANFDGIPYGPLRIQVLASGFQTYGEDFDVKKPKMDFTIKLKRPQGQFSVYEDRPKDSNPPPQNPPPMDQKKPN